MNIDSKELGNWFLYNINEYRDWGFKMGFNECTTRYIRLYSRTKKILLN